MNKKHFYMISFSVGGNITGNTVVCFDNAHITRKAHRFISECCAEVSKSDVDKIHIISISYFGHMTVIEYENE